MTFPIQRWLAVAMVALAALLFGPAPAWAQLAAEEAQHDLWGDDIGGFNISAYNQGVMGYKTPNIDRIAKEGALFTDWYGQQSCTAGRAAFITGQSPIRTGPHQGRPSRRARRHEEGRPDHRRLCSSRWAT